MNTILTNEVFKADLTFFEKVERLHSEFADRYVSDEERKQRLELVRACEEAREFMTYLQIGVQVIAEREDIELGEIPEVLQLSDDIYLSGGIDAYSRMVIKLAGLVEQFKDALEDLDPVADAAEYSAMLARIERCESRLSFLMGLEMYVEAELQVAVQVAPPPKFHIVTTMKPSLVVPTLKTVKMR